MSKSIFTGAKPRIIGATVYALNRTYGLAPAREAGGDETVVEVIDGYSGLIRTDAGNVAWHKGGLDPREVVEVSDDGKRIKIRIGTLVTDWLPAKNYTYVAYPAAS